MRNFLVAAASLVAASAVAHADPLSVSASATSAAPAPSSYVQGGVVAGGNDGYLTAGGAVEIGTRVAPNVWLHANVVQGMADELFGNGDGTYTQLRVGADAMGCSVRGVACAFIGADAGYQHTQWSGTEGWFSDDATMESYERTRMIGVARAGLDIGDAHLRWRPSLELAVSDNGINGINAMQSLAYRF